MSEQLEEAVNKSFVSSDDGGRHGVKLTKKGQTVSGRVNSTYDDSSFKKNVEFKHNLSHGTTHRDIKKSNPHLYDSQIMAIRHNLSKLKEETEQLDEAEKGSLHDTMTSHGFKYIGMPGKQSHQYKKGREHVIADYTSKGVEWRHHNYSVPNSAVGKGDGIESLHSHLSKLHEENTMNEELSPIADAITLVANDQAGEATGLIHDLLGARVLDALQGHKQQIAQTLFAPSADSLTEDSEQLDEKKIDYKKNPEAFVKGLRYNDPNKKVAKKLKEEIVQEDHESVEDFVKRGGKIKQVAAGKAKGSQPAQTIKKAKHYFNVNKYAR